MKEYNGRDYHVKEHYVKWQHVNKNMGNTVCKKGKCEEIQKKHTPYKKSMLNSIFEKEAILFHLYNYITNLLQIDHQPQIKLSCFLRKY